jgi:hypothetical protein
MTGLNLEKWTQPALLAEWWRVAGTENSAMTIPKVALARYYGLPVGAFGEVLGIHEPLQQDDLDVILIIVETLHRLSVWPKESYPPYIGILDGHAYVQWSVWAAYNIGFTTAVATIMHNRDTGSMPG